jgi:fused signal recognition particle receptor
MPDQGSFNLSDDRPPDENRDKPKPGLFKRLFGRQEPQIPPEEFIPVAETPVVEPFSPPPSPEPPATAAEQLEPSAVSEGENSKAGLFKRLFGGAEPMSASVGETLAEAALPELAAPKRTWWTRLREGLARSSGSIGTGLVEIFTKRKLDDAMLDDLEDILIRSDLGVATATKITKAVGKNRYDKMIDVNEVKAILAAEVEQVLAPLALPLTIDPAIKPFVILIVGVNGSGKTTTIGKLALKLTQEGKKVTLAAGDTFRAAAIEQLRIWGERLGCPVIAKEQGGDAAGLAFDAIKAAQANQADVLLMDTAGRLQNRAELMAELEKIIRVMKKVDASAPHTVILVLDATVGQNAMTQVEIFGRVAGVTGLVMTKLDGTARGGILVAVSEKFHLPVHFIGVGETAEDLETFEARDFARAIAGIED